MSFDPKGNIVGTVELTHITVDTVDIATGWAEQRAVWGRGETDVAQQIKDIGLHNFLPSVKLLEKKRIGSTIAKKRDASKTPYRRVLESPQFCSYILTKRKFPTTKE